MAKRPVFIPGTRKDSYVREIIVNFTWYPGFSVTQKQKSIASLQGAYHRLYGEKKLLEVSTKSPDDLGRQISAFNLKLAMGGKSYPVENVFQAGKAFEKGGPYPDLLEVTPREAKRDSRLRESGALQRFEWQDQGFPLKPSTLFYDWLYLTALSQNGRLADELLKYDGFTDIEFNPTRSFNCQARSCALHIGLSQISQV